jgi:hypothetical protein
MEWVMRMFIGPHYVDENFGVGMGVTLLTVTARIDGSF